MKEEKLYDSFLEEILQRVPQKKEIVNTLADMLCLGKEAVYRRLRNEVSFTFYEAMAIARHLEISLDNLDFDSSPKTQPFKLKLIEYINPAESDFTLMEELTTIMKSFNESVNSEFGEITNLLPQPLYVGYPNVFKFYLFKWKYQSSKSHQTVPYKDIVVLDKLHRSQEEYVRWARRLHAEYVFDPMLFKYLVTNIEYFYCIGLITRHEVRMIRDDLLRILDEIDYLSRNGAFRDTGKKVDIYISSINIDTSYVYVSSEDYRLTIIKAFLLNGIASTDKKTFEEVKRWMQSLKRQSVLITASGEKERFTYLEEHNKLIDSLSDL